MIMFHQESLRGIDPLPYRSIVIQTHLNDESQIDLYRVFTNEKEQVDPCNVGHFRSRSKDTIRMGCTWPDFVTYYFHLRTQRVEFSNV